MSVIAAEPCERCPLVATRATASRGPVPARVVLLSGTPRYHEEHEGVAFASPAFGWLEQTLAAAGIDPGSVHYATLIGCRPPYQRPVRMDEVGACRPRLDRAIDAMEPEVIVLCGHEAVESMLPGVVLSTGHGRLVKRGRRRYYPIRHPYAALHHEPYVKEVEEDLRRLGALLAGEALDAEITLDEPAPLAPPPPTAPSPDAPALAATRDAESTVRTSTPDAAPVMSTAAPAQSAEPTSGPALAGAAEQDAAAATSDATGTDETTEPAQLSLF